MLQSCVVIALRHFAKHKIFTLVNLLGLSLGLTLFILGQMVVRYESSHDRFFPKADRIYAVTSKFAEEAGEAILEYPSIRTAYKPLLESDIPQLQHVARSVHLQRMVSAGDSTRFYAARFVDPGFTRIFQFDYLYGSPAALDDAKQVLVTDTFAREHFGFLNVIGEKLTLENSHTLTIGAVIRDLPANTHFNSSLLPNSQFSIVASTKFLANTTDFVMDGNWKTLPANDFTYVMTPPGFGAEQLQREVDKVYRAYTPDDEKQYVAQLLVRPLDEMNLQVWDSLGFPVIEAVQLLSGLILLVACVNYTNLATALYFTRTREVGMRKALGATTMQLLLQCFIEAFLLVLFALLLALSTIELLLPVYNDWTGRGMQVVYADLWPLIAGLAVLTTILAASYPAFLVTRVSPLQNLQGVFAEGTAGRRVRSSLISLQFAVSVFILSLSAVIYFQNQKMAGFTAGFLEGETLVLARDGDPDIAGSHEALSRQLERVTGVQSVLFSSSVPFAMESVWPEFSTDANNIDSKIYIPRISVEPNFFAFYNIPLTEGRFFQPGNEQDHIRGGELAGNIVVNRQALNELGLTGDVLGENVYARSSSDDSTLVEYRIIGVVEDQYYFGVPMGLNPMVFVYQPSLFQQVSIRVNEKPEAQTLARIEDAWHRVLPGYPLELVSLETYFRMFFRIPIGISFCLSVFAGISLVLALMGLLGLSAFLARRRIREIAIRKVIGAETPQIVQLLIRQYSAPVLWALLVAIPLAWVTCGIYLRFFSERITYVIPVIVASALVALLSAWLVIALHALSIARQSPAASLRDE